MPTPSAPDVVAPGPRRRLPETRVPEHLRPLLVVAALVGLLCAVRAFPGGGFVDLQVYRFGGVAVLDGTRLYTEGTPGSGLPFTYPPFAALLMVPLAAFPWPLLAGVWGFASVLVLGLVVRRVLQARGGEPGPRTVALLTAGALALEPVWSSLSFGQVNLFLLGLVLVDVLRSERRHAGWMVGVAAGLKLTPLVFVVFLLFVGRFRAARTAVLAFLGTVAAGFLLAPGASWSYWSEVIWDAGRIGGLAYSGNQSVMGVLFRLTGEEPSTALWFGVASVLAGAAMLVGALAWHRGHRELGLGLGAVSMLLASPVSWDHHWVWSVPIILALWPLSRLAAVLVTGLFASSVIWIPPRTGMQELDWTPFQQVLGNSYVAAALLLTAYVLVRVARPSRSA